MREMAIRRTNYCCVFVHGQKAARNLVQGTEICDFIVLVAVLVLMDQVLLDETGHHVTSLPRGILVHGDAPASQGV